jgi:hypothetical protein
MTSEANLSALRARVLRLWNEVGRPSERELTDLLDEHNHYLDRIKSAARKSAPDLWTPTDFFWSRVLENADLCQRGLTEIVHQLAWCPQLLSQGDLSEVERTCKLAELAALSFRRGLDVVEHLLKSAQLPKGGKLQLLN